MTSSTPSSKRSRRSSVRTLMPERTGYDLRAGSAILARRFRAAETAQTVHEIHRTTAERMLRKAACREALRA